MWLFHPEFLNEVELIKSSKLASSDGGESDGWRAAEEQHLMLHCSAGVFWALHNSNVSFIFP